MNYICQGKNIASVVSLHHYLIMKICRVRMSRHQTRSMLTRIERRTALSLRPISCKSYADPHSPHFNTESEDDKYGEY